MSLPQNFRTSLHGFNREDVVRYIEYLTNKNRTQLNQLETEKKRLEEELNELREAADVSEEVSALKEENASLEARCHELAEKCDSLQNELEEASNKEVDTVDLEAIQKQYEEKIAALIEEYEKKLTEKDSFLKASQVELQDRISGLEESTKAAKEYEQKELEAYRRAERTEREANERAARVHERIDSNLRKLSEEADKTTEQFGGLAKNLVSQLDLFAQAISENGVNLRALTEAMKNVENEE